MNFKSDDSGKKLHLSVTHILYLSNIINSTVVTVYKCLKSWIFGRWLLLWNDESRVLSSYFKLPLPLEVSGKGVTMSIVRRSYFFTQLIIWCDGLEKRCSVIKDDKNLTKTKENCQFPFKYKVCNNNDICWFKHLSFKGKEYDRCIGIGDSRCLR